MESSNYESDFPTFVSEGRNWYLDQTPSPLCSYRKAPSSCNYCILLQCRLGSQTERRLRRSDRFDSQPRTGKSADPYQRSCWQPKSIEQRRIQSKRRGKSGIYFDPHPGQHTSWTVLRVGRILEPLLILEDQFFIWYPNLRFLKLKSTFPRGLAWMWNYLIPFAV